MNKHTVILVHFLFLSCFSFSQNINNTGIDTNPVLNNDEAVLFDSLFKESRENFSFRNKKAAFISGSSSTQIDRKDDFFKHYIIAELKQGKRPHIAMEKLSAKEKSQSGGFDVFIIAWSKVVFTHKQKSKIINRLKN